LNPSTSRICLGVGSASGCGRLLNASWKLRKILSKNVGSAIIWHRRSVCCSFRSRCGTTRAELLLVQGWRGRCGAG